MAPLILVDLILCLEKLLYKVLGSIALVAVTLRSLAIRVVVKSALMLHLHIVD